MTLTGGCQCRNIELRWQCVDLSLVPRACQCAYCRSKGASYVSKSGTRVTVSIRNPNLHTTVRHGSEQADFHECIHCGELVLVTSEIDGETYGALNASCIDNPRGFSPSVATDTRASSAADKQARWRANWCGPITFTG